MIGLIIAIIGLVLTIKAAIEIWNLKGDTVKKILFIVILLMTNWVGLFIYFFYAKNHMADWIK